MLRLVPLLLLVGAAAAQRYSIELYNNRTNPLTVKYGLNGEEYSVIIPKRENGVVSKWTSPMLGVSDDIIFGIHVNLLARFHAVPSTTSIYPNLEISLGYIVQSTNASIAMRLYGPGGGPSATPWIECNTPPAPLSCIKPPSTDAQFIQTSSTKYLQWDIPPYPIWFSWH